MKENSVQAKNQLEINEISAHDFNVSTIQLEIKNSAQDINTRNNCLKIKENSAHDTNVTNNQLEIEGNSAQDTNETNN